MGQFSQNEITFPNAGGPVISGMWYNPKTGDSFTVKDSFMEDNNFIILTMDNRRVDARIMQDYIQTDEKTLNEIKKHKNDNKKKQPVGQQKKVSNILGDLGEYADEFDELNDPLETPIPAKAKPETKVVEEKVSEADINNKIIKKAVMGLPKPTITVNVEFDGDIKQPVQFLVNLMGITKEDIAKEICDTYMKDMIQSVTEQVKELL
jgi:cell division septation protein DedD